MNLINIFDVLKLINEVFSKYAYSDKHYKFLNYPLVKLQKQLFSDFQVPCIQVPLLIYKAIKGTIDKDILICTASCTIFYLFLDLMDDIEDNELDGTIWEEIGKEQAINTANSYIFLSFYTLDKIKNKKIKTKLKNELYKAGYTLTLGQSKDLDSIQILPNPITALNTIKQKTGTSVQMYSRMAAITASNNKKLINLYSKIGINLGIMLQLLGDYIDIWKNNNISNDLLNKKFTLPIAYGFNKLEKDEKELLLFCLKQGNLNVINHTVIRKLLEKVNTREYLLYKIKEYQDKILEILDYISNNWNIDNSEIELIVNKISLFFLDSNKFNY